ncbi:hypothetical protein L0665_10180 [Methanogenium marinum]|uniref:Uncharacterized protein n=1 Tax=Methanogenium marinum TaxID=348610 RepID=A0A9Q4KUF5_9EURY|nr:hypothetical protein [Methanogenium marinum]MDE4908974.1 hypothetical protein [Methanogenium marinum]
MKKIELFMGVLLLLIIAVGITGCVTQEKTTVAPVTATEQTPSPTAMAGTPQPETIKETTIDTGVTKTIFRKGEDGSTSMITLNRVTKTATVEINPFYIEKPSEGLTDESVDEFMIPIAVGMMRLAFFDPEGFEEWQKEGTESGFLLEDGTEVEEENPLDGYTVTKLTLKFVEEGTNTPISDYIVTGLTENDMVVTKHR